MDRRKALKAVVAGCIGLLSGQAIFTRPAKTSNVQWDMGSIETITLVFGDKTLVLKTKDIFDSLSA